MFGCFECMAGRLLSGRVRARFPPPNGPTEGSAAWAVALKYIYSYIFDFFPSTVLDSYNVWGFLLRVSHLVFSIPSI